MVVDPDENLSRFQQVARIIGMVGSLIMVLFGIGLCLLFMWVVFHL